MAGQPVRLGYRLDIKTVAEWEQWGKLVKTWATGEDRLKDGKWYPWPTTPQELQHQMDTAKAGRVPGEIESVKVVQMTEEDLIIVLPPRADIKEAEAKIAAIQSPDYYTVPEYYNGACNNDLKVVPGQESTFNDKRVGEYVISYCG